MQVERLQLLVCLERWRYRYTEAGFREHLGLCGLAYKPGRLGNMRLSRHAFKHSMIMVFNATLGSAKHVDVELL